MAELINDLPEMIVTDEIMAYCVIATKRETEHS